MHGTDILVLQYIVEKILLIIVFTGLHLTSSTAHTGTMASYHEEMEVNFLHQDKQLCYTSFSMVY